MPSILNSPIWWFSFAKNSSPWRTLNFAVVWLSLPVLSFCVLEKGIVCYAFIIMLLILFPYASFTSMPNEMGKTSETTKLLSNSEESLLFGLSSLLWIELPSATSWPEIVPAISVAPTAILSEGLIVSFRDSTPKNSLSQFLTQGV